MMRILLQFPPQDWGIWWEQTFGMNRYVNWEVLIYLPLIVGAVILLGRAFSKGRQDYWMDEPREYEETAPQEEVEQAERPKERRKKWSILILPLLSVFPSIVRDVRAFDRPVERVGLLLFLLLVVALSLLVPRFVRWVHRAGQPPEEK